MRNFSFVEISQKVFNRNVRRITNNVINKYNIYDKKTKDLIRDDVSCRLNALLLDNPNINLDLVSIDF